VELHEYQVKSLLSRAGVVCSEHVVVDSSSDLSAILSRLEGGEMVVRPQVHGGQPEDRVEARGLEERLRALIGSRVVTPASGPEGYVVSKVLVMVPTTAERMYHISMMIDRSGNIELTASQLGKKVYGEHLFEGAFRPFQINRLVAAIGLKDRKASLFKKVVEGALQTFFRYDGFFSDLLVALTEGETFEVVDARMTCDDRALFRQPELRQMVRSSGDEREQSLPTVLVDGGGSIACIGNGIALALATADLLRVQKGFPGRVIDVGSDCVAEKVVQGMNMLGGAKAAIIHLFTGLVDGEMIAKRMQKEHPKIPMVAFLEGTNVSAARRVFNEGRSIIAAHSLPQALQTVVQRGGT
jgi:succinyl-CoA synthetase beta subunit